ncbi:MAG: pyridoxamine 5-phosphate oxidase [Acidobacteria bacterium]|nr:pyridoxamine 5-phosphate oxidase [Acidobacteriota bacterium]
MKLPAPVPDGELAGVALAAIRKAKFPMMATLAGNQPRVRPVSPVRTDGFTIYIASLRSSGKTSELEANSRVELCYMTEDHDQLRITGQAVEVADRETRESIWSESPLLRAYLGSIDNPEFMLYVVRPERVRFMREWALEYQEVPFA